MTNTEGTQPEQQEQPTELEKLMAKLDQMTRAQARTNELLAQAINNNISHTNSLLSSNGKLQSQNVSERNELGLLRQDVVNTAMWLMNIHDQIQISNKLLVQNNSICQKVQVEDELSVLREIRDELKSNKDEGKLQDYSNTATTTITVVDLEKVAPYHPVKEFIITNDGTNDLYYWVNVVDNLSGSKLKPNESFHVPFNCKVINKIFVETLTSTSAYRLLLFW